MTLNGELADRIVKAAEGLGVTPQELFEAALEEAMKPEHQEELEKAVKQELEKGGEHREI